MKTPYTVRNAITKVMLTSKQFESYEEAKTAAIRLSKDVKYTVEVHHAGECVKWFFQGEQGD